MTDSFSRWMEIAAKTGLRLAVILVFAILLTRMLKAVTGRLVHLDKSSSRGGQMRGQQARTRDGGSRAPDFPAHGKTQSGGRNGAGAEQPGGAGGESEPRLVAGVCGRDGAGGRDGGTGAGDPGGDAG